MDEIIWAEKPDQYEDGVRVPEEVQDLLDKVRHIPRLTPQEEIELGRRIQAGDQRAIAELAEANIRLVIKPAKRLARKFPHLSVDLYSAGFVGLMNASKRFNPAKGRFSTVATYWIEQAIQRFVYDQGNLVRRPVYLQDEYSRVCNEFYKLLDIFGRFPTRLEWADHCGYTLAALEELLVRFEDPISLDEPWEGDGGNRSDSLADFLVAPEISPEVEYERTELQEIIAAEMSCLSDREREVIKSRYGLVNGVCETLDEIGDRLGLCRERIRQIESIALRRLRKPLKRQLPESMISGSEDTESGEQISEALALFRKQAEPDGNILAPQALLTKKLHVSEKIARLIVRELEERGYLIPVRKKSRKGNLYRVVNSV